MFNNFLPWFVVVSLSPATFFFTAGAILDFDLDRSMDDEIRIKPFVLASTRKGSVDDAASACTEALTAAGFTVAGVYKMNDKVRVLCITNEELKRFAAQSERGGFGACLRVACTAVDGGDVQISFTNPTYMAYAYRMNGNNKAMLDKLCQVLGKEKEFGSAKGKTEKSLRKYHYAVGMEFFDEPETLAKYKDYQEAVSACEENLAKNTDQVTKVCRIDIPGKQETLFVVGLHSADKYAKDEYYMAKIDLHPEKSTAHLPYEMLVSEHKVIALHARFRIAINFTDLDMVGDGSFASIMETPAAIKKTLQYACGGKEKKDK